MRLRRGYERLLTDVHAAPSRCAASSRATSRRRSATARPRAMVLIPILAEYNGARPRLGLRRRDRRAPLPRGRRPALRVGAARAARRGNGSPLRGRARARSRWAIWRARRRSRARRTRTTSTRSRRPPSSPRCSGKRQRNAEAAAVIAKFPVRASDKERCYHFCRAFVRAFRGKPPAEVEAAFREMVAARLDYALPAGHDRDLPRHGRARDRARAREAGRRRGRQLGPHRDRTRR